MKFAWIAFILKSVNIILYENLSKTYILKLQFFDPVECQMSRDFALCHKRNLKSTLTKLGEATSTVNSIFHLSRGLFQISSFIYESNKHEDSDGSKQD